MPTEHKIPFGAFLMLMALMTIPLVARHRTSIPTFIPGGQQNAKNYSPACARSYPIADYISPESVTEDKQSERKTKNLKYNGRKSVFSPNLPEGVETLPLIDHTMARLPALPVVKSDLILLGEVTDAKAYLSNDKTGVYSEFSVRVEEVFKSEKSSQPSIGSLVNGTREGGAVRYPTGQISCVSIQYQGMPKLNSRYVLFLKSLNDEQGFFIITGYELKERRVFPLDGRDVDGKSHLSFAAFAGMEEDVFLPTVRNAVAQQRVTTGRKERP